MTQAPFIAVADDLTGAAEIAALGHRHGLESVIFTEGQPVSDREQLVVYDTDSRLDPPDVAAEKLARLGRELVGRPRGMIFKKTDSVLRGPVRGEVEALSRALGLRRVVLVPANPTLGRTIRDGQYSINGVPLNQTPFAHDPHHPAGSGSVLDLLGLDGALPVVVRNATDPLPADGLIAGNVESVTQAQAWARTVALTDLPAGGADFFSALLDRRGLKPTADRATFAPAAPTLIVSGTTSSTGALRAHAGRDGVAIAPMPAEIADPAIDATTAVQVWIDAVASRLAAEGAAVVLYDGPRVPGPFAAAAIRHTLARCVRDLAGRGTMRHVVVEGGATAASIARECRWSKLQLVHEWAQGVASLRPSDPTAPVLTLKPGSYAWPAALWTHILATASPH